MKRGDISIEELEKLKDFVVARKCVPPSGILAMNMLENEGKRTAGEDNDERMEEYGTSTGFIRRFSSRYGHDAPAKFKALAESPFTSLSDIAAYFGFSRQYAWQIYKKLTGHSYSQAVARKKRARIAKEPKANSLRFRYFIMVRNKILTMGIPCRIGRGPYGFILIAGRLKLAVKYSKNPIHRGERIYFYISNLRGAALFDYDFLVGVCDYGNKIVHYIIPREQVPVNGVYVQPGAGPSDSKYSKYKEAWSLIIVGK